MMKIRTTSALLVYLAMAVLVSRSDSPPGPDSYVFAITSPSNLFYAVQTFTPIPFEGPQGAKKRFQVFSTATGKLRWETIREWGFGTQSEVMLADDGEHVIVLPFWISASGSTLWALQKEGVSEAERKRLLEKFEKSLDRYPVVTFYKRDNVVRKVFFHDLAIPLESVRDVSVSHAVIHHHTFANFYTSEWNHAPIHEEQQRRYSKSYLDRRPDQVRSTITITFVNGKARTFDYTTGILLKTEEVKDYAPPSSFEPADPSAEPLPDKRSIQQDESTVPSKAAPSASSDVR